MINQRIETMRGSAIRFWNRGDHGCTVQPSELTWYNCSRNVRTNLASPLHSFFGCARAYLAALGDGLLVCPASELNRDA